MGVQASCGHPLFEEVVKIMIFFHVLPKKRSIFRDPMTHIGCPLFNSWLQSLFSQKSYFLLHCAISMAIQAERFLVFSLWWSVTAVHGIFSYYICRTKPYNAACYFSLIYSVHIASGRVLVKGKVSFNSKDWASYKMKIMFTVDWKVTHFFCEITLENEMRTF